MLPYALSQGYFNHDFLKIKSILCSQQPSTPKAGANKDDRKKSGSKTPQPVRHCDKITNVLLPANLQCTEVQVLQPVTDRHCLYFWNYVHVQYTKNILREMKLGLKQKC